MSLVPDSVLVLKKEAAHLSAESCREDFKAFVIAARESLLNTNTDEVVECTEQLLLRLNSKNDWVVSQLLSVAGVARLIRGENDHCNRLLTTYLTTSPSTRVLRILTGHTSNPFDTLQSMPSSYVCYIEYYLHGLACLEQGMIRDKRTIQLFSIAAESGDGEISLFSALSLAYCLRMRQEEGDLLRAISILGSGLSELRAATDPDSILLLGYLSELSEVCRMPHSNSSEVNISELDDLLVTALEETPSVIQFPPWKRWLSPISAGEMRIGIARRLSESLVRGGRISKARMLYENYVLKSKEQTSRRWNTDAFVEWEVLLLLERGDFADVSRRSNHVLQTKEKDQIALKAQLAAADAAFHLGDVQQAMNLLDSCIERLQQVEGESFLLGQACNNMALLRLHKGGNNKTSRIEACQWFRQGISALKSIKTEEGRRVLHDISANLTEVLFSRKLKRQACVVWLEYRRIRTDLETRKYREFLVDAQDALDAKVLKLWLELRKRKRQ